jgi:uncharacterized protein
MRLLPLLVVATLLASPSFAVPQAPPAQATAINPTTGTEMTTFYMVLLRRGPAWTASATPESMAISRAHQENIQKLTAAGKMVVAGPFLDQTGAQALSGLFILRVGSLEEARATVSTDPAVTAGRFTFEIIPWMGPKTLKY